MTLILKSAMGFFTDEGFFVCGTSAVGILSMRKPGGMRTIIGRI